DVRELERPAEILAELLGPRRACRARRLGEALHRHLVGLLATGVDDDRRPLLGRGRRREDEEQEAGDPVRMGSHHSLSSETKTKFHTPASGGAGSGLALRIERSTPSSYQGFPERFRISGSPRRFPPASSSTSTTVASESWRKPGGTAQ